MTYYRLCHVQQYLGTYCATSSSNKVPIVPNPAVPTYCIMEATNKTRIISRLFDTQRLFSISTQLVPSAIKAYDLLGVKHEPLRLITPQFETPLPPFQPAVFPPSFKELTNPQLELFDLV